MSIEALKQQYPELYRQVWERGQKSEKERVRNEKFRDSIRRILAEQHARPACTF